MARIRSIHPGLLTDEAFAQLTLECPIAGLLLLGLWMEADDSGTFEWKPLTLKMRCLPAAPVRVEELLEVLQRVNILQRFEIEGRAFGVIRNFVKWQRPKDPADVHPYTVDSRAYAGFVDGKRPRPKVGRPGRSAPAELFDDDDLSNSEKVGSGSDFRGVNSELGAQRKEEGGRKVESSSSSAGASEIDLSKARPLPTRDLLEAEARALMGEQPVVIDVDFSPVAALLDEPGVIRADVIAGLTEAAATPNFRPVSWRQLAGWVRKAAKNRIAAGMAARAGPGSRAPPRGARPPSSLSVCLEMARGDSPRGFAESSDACAGPGPVIDGRAVAM